MATKSVSSSASMGIKAEKKQFLLGQPGVNAVLAPMLRIGVPRKMRADKRKNKPGGYTNEETVTSPREETGRPLAGGTKAVVPPGEGPGFAM